MNKNSDSGASAGQSPARGPRIHRTSKGQVKSPRRILLVDDNKIILKTTSSKLKAAGYEVLTAEDGGSAIRQVRQLQPDLILLDLNFPPDVGCFGVSWDGLQILSWLRTNGLHKVPVIVITGQDLEKYEQRLTEAGVLDIFLKPIDHEALLAAIRGFLEVGEPTSSPTDPSAAEPPPVHESATGRKILLVDDASDWRYLGASFLGERDYEVVTAEDPICAMLQVSEFNPSLVILDLDLGGQSGVPLLKLLAERHPDLPVLIYTGMDLDNEEVSELCRQGAWNCLKKGSLDDLAAGVEKTLSAPKARFVQGAAEPAQQESAEPEPLSAEQSMPAVAENDNDATANTTQRPQAIPEWGAVFPSLGGLRTGTTAELLSAVATARSVFPEESQATPEPAPEPVALPEEVIESASESILIIEDDAAFADTIRAFLESQSFRVSSVTTGAEAMSLIAAADVDLILFDLTLADLRVSRFYEQVQALKPNLCSRIIFMTSDDSHPADDGFVRRLKGPSIWKPFPMDWLVEAVQAVRKSRGVTNQAPLAAK